VRRPRAELVAVSVLLDQEIQGLVDFRALAGIVHDPDEGVDGHIIFGVLLGEFHHLRRILCWLGILLLEELVALLLRLGLLVLLDEVLLGLGILLNEHLVVLGRRGWLVFFFGSFRGWIVRSQ